MRLFLAGLLLFSFCLESKRLLAHWLCNRVRLHGQTKAEGSCFSKSVGNSKNDIEPLVKSSSSASPGKSSQMQSLSLFSRPPYLSRRSTIARFLPDQSPAPSPAPPLAPPAFQTAVRNVLVAAGDVEQTNCALAFTLGNLVHSGGCCANAQFHNRPPGILLGLSCG